MLVTNLSVQILTFFKNYCSYNGLPYNNYMEHMQNNFYYEILCDNHVHHPDINLESEHGFSVWLEYADKKILFDTGNSEIFIRNAERLNVDLSEADFLVFSHGHYDHTGGLCALDKIIRDDVLIYAHKDFLQKERYSLHKDGKIKYVGISDECRSFFEKRKSYVRFIDSPTEISEDILLTGYVPRETPFEDTGGSFWLDAECKQADNINDDMSLWIKGKDGLLIFSGCAHSGIINTINHIRRESNCDKAHAIIGGTHLKNADDMRLQKTAEFLKNIKPEILTTCHCSGEKINSLLVD